MKTIVNSKDLIKTYSYEHQWRAYQYLKAIKFSGVLSAKKTAIKLNIPFSRVSDWFYAGNKPFPIRTINKAKINNWIPLYPSPELAYLVGYNTGDGNVSNNLLHTTFISKNKEILYKVADDIFKLFNLKINKFYFYGNSYSLQVSDTVITRIFHTAGAPKGNKTKVPFLVPKWIYKPEIYGCSPEFRIKIQRRYLQGLNDAELKKPYTKNYTSFDALRLEMYKDKDYLSNHIKFLKQISNLYNKFGIQTKIGKPKLDGSKFVISINIIGNLLNLLKFTTNVGFRFNIERLDKCQMYIKKARKTLKWIDKYEKAIEMLHKNISYIKVAKTIGADEETVRSWKLKVHRPVNFERREQLRKYLSEVNNVVK